MQYLVLLLSQYNTDMHYYYFILNRTRYTYIIILSYFQIRKVFTYKKHYIPKIYGFRDLIYFSKKELISTVITKNYYITLIINYNK